MITSLASWDSPPRRGEPGYDAFVTAFNRFVHSGDVLVPELSKKDAIAFDKRPKDEFRRKHALKDPAGLELGQDSNLKLMPFQVLCTLYLFPLDLTITIFPTRWMGSIGYATTGGIINRVSWLTIWAL